MINLIIILFIHSERIFVLNVLSIAYLPYIKLQKFLSLMYQISEIR